MANSFYFPRVSFNQLAVIVCKALLRKILRFHLPRLGVW